MDSLYVYQKGYHRGYTAGYQDGIRAAQNEQYRLQIPPDIIELPIEAMEISPRAFHCLRNCGCVSIKNVADLDENKIASMRGLGKVSAAEIANWLWSHDIKSSAWTPYTKDIR